MRIDFLFSVPLVLTATMTLGATYQRSSQLTGQSFLDAFNFQAISDPTHGRVTYVNESTAKADGLVSVANNKLTLRADYTTKLSSSGSGRKSFRIESTSQYKTHVAIFDIAHMPQGCGTWPAVCVCNLLWSVDLKLTMGQGSRGRLAESRSQGEVDIVEGVNDQTPNKCSLHTGSSKITFEGRKLWVLKSVFRLHHALFWLNDRVSTVDGTDCYAYDNGNAGCGVKINDNKSYGPQFNDNGGGCSARITGNQIFFWERTSSSVPSDVKSPGSNVNTSNWGTPAAYFPNTHCDFSTHFGAHNIIINLTFCGDWAGSSSVYANSGCPSTCVDYVNNNPSAFKNAYFEFNSLNIYQ
ncbi:glycoside hydrolase family 16 protein [Suillus luteus UH-Slu-Lm8-n1]|uniref:Glycoside hydrolase family 16 protein n=1 Tax=Suillus luteus UH-Slu-Lm8-n1 TaxID=930992 RepID=A0A0D0AFE6_9AGAM|nr:glycoside hydrolase family 16 protein [Suillus luteus UH-Slu-Lm8-n1]